MTVYVVLRKYSVIGTNSGIVPLTPDRQWTNLEFLTSLSWVNVFYPVYETSSFLCTEKIESVFIFVHETTVLLNCPYLYSCP